MAGASSQMEATPGQGRREAMASTAQLEFSLWNTIGPQRLDLSQALVYCVTRSHCGPGLSSRFTAGNCRRKTVLRFLEEMLSGPLLVMLSSAPQETSSSCDFILITHCQKTSSASGT